MTPSGEPGMTMEVFTSPPSTDTTTTTTTPRTPVDTVPVHKTEMHLVDYTNPHINPRGAWFASLTGSFTADYTGEYELGLVVCGTARLFVNDVLVVDNATVQRQGDAFYGSATVEERGRVAVKEGERYTVRVDFGSAETAKLPGISGLLHGGGSLRIGGCRVLNAKEEIARAVNLAGGAEQVVICAGLNADWETEGHDREVMDLPGHMDELIAAVAEVNPKITVVMQSGTPVAMSWIDKVGAVIQAWYGGNETGNAIADILFGDENPSGKLSLSFPKKLSDNPAFLNVRAEGGRTLYGEDVYIGYRFYEYADREALFPFGHGLSYTTFAFANLEVVESDGTIKVKLSVANTGVVRGQEVVQVYVAPPSKQAVNRPKKELKGFAKVAVEPGKSEIVNVEIETKYAASYWDEFRKQWCAEAGQYAVIISDSSAAKEGKTLRGFFTVAKTFWWSGV